MNIFLISVICYPVGTENINICMTYLYFFVSMNGLAFYCQQTLY